MLITVEKCTIVCWFSATIIPSDLYCHDV